MRARPTGQPLLSSATALSPRRLVRFYQIQHELEVLIELRAVSQIPKMKWWQEK
jgi:hypothetical protein